MGLTMSRAAASGAGAPPLRDRTRSSFVTSSMAPLSTASIRAAAPWGQGLTLVPISAQLELFCPPCNPT